MRRIASRAIFSGTKPGSIPRPLSYSSSSSSTNSSTSNMGDILSRDGSNTDSANYKPGYRTTRALIEKYQRKSPSAKEETVPGLWNEKRASFDNISIDYVDSNGVTRIDNQSIAKAFYFYEKTADVEKALYLCNRLSQSGIIPHANSIGCIARILLGADSHVTEEVYLNLLHTINTHNITLNKRDFGTFVSRMRFVKDSFVLEVFRQYLLDYIRINGRSYNDFRPIIQRDYAIACLNNGNVERAYDLYRKLPRNCRYPEYRLAVLLSGGADGLKQAVDLCRDRSKSLGRDSEVWASVLEETCNKNYQRGWKVLWEKYYRFNTTRLPTGSLDKVISLSAAMHDSETVKILLQELSLRGNHTLSTSVCSDVLSMALTANENEKEKVKLNELVELLACLLDLQPNFTHRDCPDFAIKLAESVKDSFELPDVVNDVVKGLKNEKLGSLVLNLCLMGCYRSTLAGNTSAILKLYNQLFRVGLKPDTQTIEILSRVALRLKNTKLLAYEIYEHASSNGIKVSRLAFENMLKCQLSGSNYQTVFFFLIKMTESHVPLRKSYSDMISAMFQKIGDKSFSTLQQVKDNQHFSEFMQTHSQFMENEEVEKTATAISPDNYRPYNYKADVWLIKQFRGES